MKRFCILPILFIAAQVSYSQELALQWQDLERGAQYAVYEGEYLGINQCISILRYPSSKFRTDIVNDPGSSCGKTSTLAMRHGAFAAINGSYFNMKTLYPSTYVKEDNVQEGFTRKNEMSRVDGIVSTNRKKVSIVRSDTLHYQQNAKKYQDSMASGPVLLLGGKDVVTPTPSASFFTGRHPRTIIGYTKGAKWVYFIEIDGRFPKAKGMTVEEEAKLCLELGLYDALNLDGGGSSCLWTVKTGVLGHPYDNKKYDHHGERRVPNIIMIK